MIGRRVALLFLATSSSFCTDQNLQMGDKIVDSAAAEASGDLRERSGVPAKVSLGQEEKRPGLALKSDGVIPPAGPEESSPAPLVSASGQGVCDAQTPTCGPQLTVHFPMEESFQEGSGGPSEPMELRGILEFFQASDCLQIYIRKTRDLRSSFRSGCAEVEQGIATVSDGGRLSLSTGDYYVRVRGHDGAPYTHLLLAHKDAKVASDLYIEPVEGTAISENAAAQSEN